MKLPLFQVDAFADEVFSGNPAAVCPLDEWLPDTAMQMIAAENNLSETAFFVQTHEAFELRWFTPVAEVDLCGHATLAAAHILFSVLDYAAPSIQFNTRSGPLAVSRSPLGLSMDFPLDVPQPGAVSETLAAGLGQRPDRVLTAADYIAVFDTEEAIGALEPDFSLLATMGLRGVVATAPGRAVDFVSRCFYPKLGVNEDPVTGSAHCQLAPYWRTRLQRDVLSARQLSKRGGSVHCAIHDRRVVLSGKAVTFLTGQIEIPNCM